MTTLKMSHLEKGSLWKKGHFENESHRNMTHFEKWVTSKPITSKIVNFEKWVTSKNWSLRKMSHFEKWVTSGNRLPRKIGYFEKWVTSKNGLLRKIGYFEKWVTSKNEPLRKIYQFQNLQLRKRLHSKMGAEIWIWLDFSDLKRWIFR